MYHSVLVIISHSHSWEGLLLLASTYIFFFIAFTFSIFSGGP